MRVTPETADLPIDKGASGYFPVLPHPSGALEEGQFRRRTTRRRPRETRGKPCFTSVAPERGVPTIA